MFPSGNGVKCYCAQHNIHYWLMKIVMISDQVCCLLQMKSNIEFQKYSLGKLVILVSEMLGMLII